MLLSLTTTARPATTLGPLLGRDPEVVQSFALPFGQAHVFFPEASEQRCTAALVIETDAPWRGIGLAITHAYASALAREDRSHALLLEARIDGVPLDVSLVRHLFEPLGYAVELVRAEGEDPCPSVSLRAAVPLATLLRHLSVTLPLLGDDEASFEHLLGLADERNAVVHEVLRRVRARRVIDLGCGDGALVRTLLADRSFEQVVGVDASLAALERARTRLRIDHLSKRQRARVELFQASITYRDPRFEGFDAACVLEVLEHLEPSCLLAFERVLFEYARPDCVLVTTPNIEANPRLGLARGALRNREHRFEWTRAQFEDWASAVAGWHGYDLELERIGPVDPELGPPTQMAVFTR